MKIKADFSELWECANRMGRHEVEFDLQSFTSREFDIDAELSSTKGLDIELEDLEFDSGVLSVKGRQVLPCIPDQGSQIDDVLSGRADGKKFHVADCRTLESMRQQRRFNRYKATYNISGSFHVYGVSYATSLNREGEAELKVCKNCLTHLNYEGYATKVGREKANVFEKFNIAEFLSTYSTLFRTMPDTRHFEDAGGYSDDWKTVSESYRASVGYRCESCGVELDAHRSLLHTHHISGNKRDNASSNLLALCLDCHRKQPKHSYMRITHDQMALLNRLRKEQRVSDRLRDKYQVSEWEHARMLADKAVDGLLRSYEARNLPVPEIGYEVEGANGEIVAELEIAWPTMNPRCGIAIDPGSLVAARESGWRVFTVREALQSMNKR